MNGDLISRSRLMEEIRGLRVTVTGLRAGKGILSEFEKQYRESVLKAIDNQPTAYDVNKVVEQLEGEKGIAFLTLANTGDKVRDVVYDEVMVYLNTAIEIVKAGGVKCVK